MGNLKCGKIRVSEPARPLLPELPLMRHGRPKGKAGATPASVSPVFSGLGEAEHLPVPASSCIACSVLVGRGFWAAPHSETATWRSGYTMVWKFDYGRTPPF